ncbi:MAG: DUF1653 domain-containing protein [Lachnospiraceae bacterium]|jgi:hypothetical protein|nr:DUF1653 domain-containing protein [Lachnospiraceae bacterium]
MSFIPKPHEIYKHFKGNLYQITAVAEHTETGEKLVVYQALYGDFKTYARPLSMFTERLSREKYPDAGQEFRFELQGPDGDRQKRETQAASEVEEKEASDTKLSDTESSDTKSPDMELSDAEAVLDPLLLEFLDADTYEQRLNILAGLHHRITDEMITTMGIACDVEVESGDVEERYESLKACLLMLERYECNRIR